MAMDGTLDGLGGLRAVLAGAFQYGCGVSMGLCNQGFLTLDVRVFLMGMGWLGWDTWIHGRMHG